MNSSPPHTARAGKKVLVLEPARDARRLCCHGPERGGGYKVSTGAYLVSSLQERIVRELELGTVRLPCPAQRSHFFSVFSRWPPSVFLAGRKKRLSRKLRKFSTRDAEAFLKYEAYLERLAAVVESLLVKPNMPELPPRQPSRLRRIFEIAGAIPKARGPREITGFVKIFTQSAADLLDTWGLSRSAPEVTLATDGVTRRQRRPAVGSARLIS